MSKSVCVIGAGIGGLTAGAYLANKGYTVTVLEKATTVGGSAGWYVRKGRMFPTGATIAFGLEPGGLLRELLNEVGAEIQADELRHPMDVILPDQKVSIYKNTKDWENELKLAFPSKSADVLRFWRDLHQLGQDVLAVTNCKVSLPIQKFYDLGELPKYAIKHPKSIARLARYARWTVQDFLKKYDLQNYEPLCQLLNAQLLDAVQIDITEASLLPSSLALTIYRNGSFFVHGGMGQLCRVFAERIEEQGGKVVLASLVKGLDYDKESGKWTVESRKGTSAFDIVINNSGVSFGHHTSYADSKELSWGAFRVDAVLSERVRRDILNGRNLPFAYQIVPNLECYQLSKVTHGPVYVTFQDSIDVNGDCVNDEVIMTISVHTDYNNWLSLTKKEYKNMKNQLKNELIQEANRVIPIKEEILFEEAGTPLTYKKFIGKAGVGGFPLTVASAIMKPKSVRSSLPHFYIVGEQVFPGPGTLSSALSGYYAARAIMKGK
ncbi:NAD(P)/FAD-dependent oxidoreductase [Bacillus sp. 31A1R]|uniref:NAD(P)/FAD-dependent oxidoreductase n=1 Tax=Robertmurraya mangrovi TaxID=3098077 RepID=A0ABU5J2P4_9BACI|nr:NAD(P)/FAD-dependent oxidoreductase [Bacillus sp. 31A1R]MDZ5473684.1 NAD(P)/FAD-dependent oxidoreductase [Bacillus sp. 31A1R]